MKGRVCTLAGGSDRKLRPRKTQLFQRFMFMELWFMNRLLVQTDEVRYGVLITSTLRYGTAVLVLLFQSA
jgi:hypothetical protein